ncbi:TonB-dependent receptor [Aquariibacter albus]|uniref:TonB-dependent receptor n=1 Tax=Aquariibacter albus TaxID=2759899 RepID=A0A839HRC8_9BURK|nr:TonB-dependent receptor [Aquariibacter albus]MBB1161611.1 TonB-dependent receptor [Aquariibacter albus]
MPQSLAPQRAARPRLHPLAALLRGLLIGTPGLALPALAQQTPAAAQLPGVEVIGTSPLPGQGIDRDLLPYSTQLLKREQADRTQAPTLSDFLNRRAPGVQVNDIQGSPYQGDLSYRGFRASPLLGAGQGLSVYLDGVRVNEPFGDVVNFDLIPEFAVRTLSLVPGANPAFGLNSLGGALSYTTHDGRSAPGARAELSYGSFARKKLGVSYGLSDDSGWHSYIAASAFDEKGWRDHSDGTLGNVLAKVGHDNGGSDWTVSLLAGRSRLVGNGLLPAYEVDDDGLEKDLYFQRRGAVYTHPDLTKNELLQLSVNANHAIDAKTTLSSLLYVRKAKRNTVNGDEAEDAPVNPGDPTASFNTTSTTQTSVGGGLRLASTHGAHQWQVGAQFEASRTRYAQFEQEGMFDDSRGVVPIAGEERELSARVRGRAASIGLYASDTYALSERTHLTGTLRYNRSRVSNTLTTRDDDTDVVESKPKETFTYNSLNPALGIAHRLAGGPTLFANVARNTRVPTVIELGCADPNEPCRLPAGLQADPYLAQVKSTTVELGFRWPLSRDTRLNLALFRTDNRDDILFRSTSVSGQTGFFQNFDKTRNQGLEAELSSRFGALDLSASYSYLKATYEADGLLRQGERNVQITPGTRIAGLPKHTLKLAADWAVGQGWTLGADAVLLSSRTVSGNEDGLLEDDDGDPATEPEARRLKIAGYAIFNLRSQWRFKQDWTFYASVANVFDRRYENFGALAETIFNAQGGNAYAAERDALFVAPGTPRSVVMGLRYRF